jgi:DNA-binding protein HU-beta
VPTEIGFAAALARSIATLYRSTSSSESRSTMNQADLIAHVADAAGVSKTDASKATDAVLSAVSDELTAGKDVRLNGFGVFSTAERAAREGRNPQTGAAIQIAASKAAKFTPAKALKDRLNGAS